MKKRLFQPGLYAVFCAAASLHAAPSLLPAVGSGRGDISNAPDILWAGHAGPAIQRCVQTTWLVGFYDYTTTYRSHQRMPPFFAVWIFGVMLFPFRLPCGIHFGANG